jgi:hypothetical protein
MSVTLPEGKVATFQATGSRAILRQALEKFQSIVMIAYNPSLVSGDVATDLASKPDPITLHGIEIVWDGYNFTFYTEDSHFSPYVLTTGFFAA